jgi:foldase protein PrsA
MEKKTVEPVLKNISGTNSAQTFNLVVGALVVVVLALGFMRYKYLFVPAVVNGSPIYSWQYVKVLNQTAGKQVMDQLVVEKLIAQEADKQKVTLTNEEVDAEFARLDKQFESAGGLDAFLSTQGLAKDDIQNQLELNLKVQKIVAGQVNVTDEEVAKYYTENKADYVDVKEADAKVQIKQMLADQALQQQVGTWIQDLRSKAQVTLNLPNAK